MNKFSLILFFAFTLNVNLSTAQSIIGQWNYPTENMQFQFYPIEGNGYGIYKVQYSNGYIHKDYYQLQGQQLGLARFNNGADQYYQIIQLDGLHLVLQDDANYQYPMTKVKPIIASNKGIKNNRYKVSSSTVLAKVLGQTMTEGDYYKNLQLIEFLLNVRLSGGELAKVKKELIIEFRKSPTAFLRQSKEAYTQMQQLYQLTDATQIALAQSVMLAQLYPVLLHDPENQDFIQLLNKYNKVLAYDQANGVALTIQDVDAMINLTNFHNQLKGLNVDFTAQERQQLIKTFTSNFQKMSLEEKRSICVLDGIYDHFYGNYQRMNTQEKEQFRQQLLNEQQPKSQPAINQNFKPGTSEHLAYLDDKLNRTGVLDPLELQAYKDARQGNRDYYTMMQNMQMESHVTSMNIIENMGNSGDYWEVKYD